MDRKQTNENNRWCVRDKRVEGEEGSRQHRRDRIVHCPLYVLQSQGVEGGRGGEDKVKRGVVMRRVL